MKRKNSFGVFLIVVLLVVLVFLWAREVFSQEQTPDSLWIFFEKGSTAIQPWYSAELKIMAEKIKTGWTVQLFADADSTEWVDKEKKESLALDGGLIIGRGQAVAKALGLEKFKPRPFTGHNKRTVLVVLSPPAPPPPPDSTKEKLEDLEGEFKKHVADQAKDDSTNALLLKNIEDSLAYVEGAVGNLKIPRLSLGVGATSVYYLQNNYAIVPTIYVHGRLTNRFGWQATGGILPTDSEMFDGVAGLGLFIKPISFVKIYSGYLLESYFDKNFQWAKDSDRTDAVTLLVGLEKNYQKVSGEISLGGFRDFRNGRWGAVNSLTITFNF